jgi:hypothetical protein
MFKLQPRDKDLLSTIVVAVVLGGVILFLIGSLGEVHGLICAVIMLMVQFAFLNSRVSALERELRTSREPREQTPVVGPTPR